ncbi:curli-like amyloid fiber formation chaperone CsgH [Pararhizobium sp. IMCC21322]|uniref:curli-like amyloid fiber formation chaperone CsgH n=1 Tax=Pararhizobium sp. IMCC21322 TaxID=3067903 RepID=UPI00274235E8|nr:curli-like amyloid fiber formation chaperone CsgH [Pararhizobium sp. IMCC21322]
MTRFSKHMVSGSAALLALSLTGVALAGTNTDNASDDPISCEIKATENRGMITLETMIHSDTSINGQYRFKVKSAGRSGSTNLSQGSNFRADAGEPLQLGRMMLSSGSVYDASLEVTVSGVTFNCAERIGGAT